MGDVETRYRRLLGSGRNTERIVFFSDAVFAIAMTLLVLDIRVPDVADDELGDALVDLIPEIFAYVLSFAIIARNWVAHHSKFRAIESYDGRLITLNLLLLLVVAFLPFPTALLSEFGPEVPAVVLYAGTVGGVSLVQYAMWSYARRAGLFADFVDMAIYRMVRRNLLVIPGVFAVSIVIALVDQPLVAMFSWIALAPASLIVDQFGRTRADDLTPASGIRSPEA